MGVPVFVDVRDLWPDVFADVATPRLRKLLRLPIHLWQMQLSWALVNATGILALSESYLEWALARAGRPRQPRDGVFHVTYPDPSGEDDIALEEETRNWGTRGVPSSDDHLTCCFFGGLGAVSDLGAILEAARHPAVRALPLRFVLCGAGAQLERLRHLAAHQDNVLLPGHVSFAAVRALASISQLGLAPYRPIDNFRHGIPNKAVEYLALGLGVLWGVPDGELAELLVSTASGLVFDSSSPISLVEALVRAATQPAKLAEMRTNARKLYAAQFAENDVMTRFCDHVERMA